MVTWRRFVAETAIAACVFICPDGRAGETRDVRELKVAAFERRAVSVGLGGEFPGAKGKMSYTNDVARLDFDFTNGGNYVTMSVGQIAEGGKRLYCSFRCGCDADVVVVVRARDAKGDTYVAGRTALKPGAVKITVYSTATNKALDVTKLLGTDELIHGAEYLRYRRL